MNLLTVEFREVLQMFSVETSLKSAIFNFQRHDFQNTLRKKLAHFGPRKVIPPLQNLYIPFYRQWIVLQGFFSFSNAKTVCLKPTVYMQRTCADGRLNGRTRT